MTVQSLTAPERETIIRFDDETGTADIWSAQRPIITKLRKNPLATEVDSGRYGTTVWARFEIAADRVSFLRTRVTRPDLKNPQKTQQNLAKARARRWKGE